MNVVQVARRFVRSDWGGTETAILETSKRLLSVGHRTEIICPNALAETPQESIAGVNVTRYPYFYPYLGLNENAKIQLDKKGGNLLSFPLMRRLRAEQPLDLIHLHTGKRLGGMVRHVARKRSIPYVVSLHGGVFDVPEEESRSWTAPTRKTWEWGKALGWWFGSRKVLDEAAAIICVGRKESELVRSRYPGQRVVHLPNGVDVERYRTGSYLRFRRQHRIPDNATVLLTVGRIDPQKNQLALVRILPQLRKSHPQLHLLLVGHITNEQYHRTLLDEIRDLGLTRNVTLIPGIDPESQDIVDAYHSADVMVLPSIHEPFGIVLVEAWAAGLPVAASRVGGIASLIRDGDDGVMFDPGDNNAIGNAIDGLLRNPVRRHLLARNGCAKATDQYSWNRITEQLVEVYKEVTDGCRKSV
jgi:glycosyltransferase involved in cell wall biosynthesis